MVYDVQNHGVVIDTREIFVAPARAEEEDNQCIDAHVANEFIRNLSILNSMNKEPILVHIITCGGDWNYGMAMFDAIKSSPSDIITLSYAHSRSMSSVIPQAATWRIIMPNAPVLLHWGKFAVAGNCTSCFAEADWYKKDNETMLDIYAERAKEGFFFRQQNMDFKAVREYLRDQMDRKQEYFMTARDAVNMGLMDAVLGDEEFETIEGLRTTE
jgi:ATP-dependent protease ClpP protease subunit